MGYLLGLGDRHPSNLMLDRYSGKLLHIDFGDCFEASMHREKFPEKVPFRLTRMMVKGAFPCNPTLLLAILAGHVGSAYIRAYLHGCPDCFASLEGLLVFACSCGRAHAVGC